MSKVEKILQQIKEKGAFRSLKIDSDTIDTENRTAEFSVTSNKPIEHWFGDLILEHTEDAIIWDRFNDGASFRDTHWGDQIGVIEKAWIDHEAGKMRIRVRFSKTTARANEVWGDIEDGIRRNVSARFEIHKMELVEEEKDKMPVYRATKWEPIHASMEPDGADFSVGVGRGFNDESSNNKLGSKTNIIHKGVTKMDDDEKKLKEERELKAKQEKALADARKKGGEERAEQIASIYSMARSIKDQLPGIDLEKEADGFVKAGKSDRDFWGFVEEKLADPKAVKKPDFHLDMSDRDIQEYSLNAALAAQIPGVSQSVIEAAQPAFEASRAIAEKIGQEPKGLFIPNDIQRAATERRIIERVSQYRDLTSGGSTSGAELVGTDHLGGSFIELLRNKMLTVKLGAKFLSGLKGNVAIPKLTSAATFGWVSTEGAGVTESAPSTGSVLLTPHEGSANVDLSRQLILQSSPDAELLVKDDLSTIVALGIDHAAINGTGEDGQPRGVLNTTGIGSVDLATMGWDAALEFEKDVDAGNALDGNLAHIMKPAVRAALKGRLKSTGVAGYICEKNMINDYPALTTEQMAANAILFGNFAQLIIGEWGGLDIQFYRAPRTGIVTYTVFKTVDVAVRQPAAFSAGTNFS